MAFNGQKQLRRLQQTLIQLCLLSIFMASSQVGACDSDLTFEQIVNQAGFIFESHLIESSGYLLTLYRIPGAKKAASESTDGSSQPPVLFQHGIYDSAYAWVMNHAEKSPAFLASQAGYDVWLVNSRGSAPSRHHITLDPDDKRDRHNYWDFDWEDMGREDLPVIFNYIMKVTKHQKIAFIGHQEGTTQMFTSLDSHGDFFAEHMSIFIALSPVTQLSNTKSDLVKFSAQKMQILTESEVLFDTRELFGPQWQKDRGSVQFCNMLPLMCTVLDTYTEGFSPNDDKDRYIVYMSHYPSGGPLRSLLHYAQNYQQKRFQGYAHGYLGGNFKTDKIQVGKVKGVPVALFAAKDDKFATVEDARLLRNALEQTLVHYEEVVGGQTSFLIGKDMKYFQHGVLDLLALFHPVSRHTQPITINKYRPHAKIQMTEKKYLELEDYSLKRSQDLKWLHKNLLMYLM